ncbi:MAG: hypothetical protein U5N85_16230 [Arcicella sp.]|nr:hypothetical protein [Arcicella sp.]
MPKGSRGKKKTRKTNSKKKKRIKGMKKATRENKEPENPKIKFDKTKIIVRFKRNIKALKQSIKLLLMQFLKEEFF